jgi:hypothetical protein
LALLVESQFFLSDGYQPSINVSLAQNRQSRGRKKRKKAMLRNFKVILAVLVVLVLAGGAYAFANTNGDIPDSAAGYSPSTVSGYTVDAIVYKLNTTDPSTIDAITFTLTGTVDAQTVKINTNATTPAWKDCGAIPKSVAGVQSITCTYSGSLLVADVTDLNVVASSSLQP